jgi:ketosteroid isomerase-like protein
MMTRLTPLVLALLVAASCAPDPASTNPVPPADRQADEDALRHAKVVTWRQLYDESDAEGLHAFLADDFVLIGGANGFTPKVDEVEALRNDPWAGPPDFLYTIEDIVFLTADAAIVYGVGTSTRASADGSPCRHRYLSSNTFRKEEGAWRPVTSHVSDATCTPITG